MTIIGQICILVKGKCFCLELIKLSPIIRGSDTFLFENILQWAPLNWITLGPRQTDPINRLIPLTDKYFGINSKQALNIVIKMIPLTE